MNLALETDQEYWREENIETCFVDSIKNLVQGLKANAIIDIFFKKVDVEYKKNIYMLFSVQYNMLSRLSKNEPEVINSSANFFDKLLEKYKDNNTLSGFFPR